MKAFLLTAWNIFWTAFRYPFHTTVIDAKTGRIIGHYKATGKEKR